MKKYSPSQKSYNTILYSKKEFSATITLNRPHVHNALNLEMLQELGDALQKAQWDDDIAVIVVTGAGTKAVRARGVEAGLTGKTLDQATIETAAAKAADGVDVQADLQGPVEYKSHLLRVYARRTIEAALKRAKGGA